MVLSDWTNGKLFYDVVILLNSYYKQRKYTIY